MRTDTEPWSDAIKMTYLPLQCPCTCRYGLGIDPVYSLLTIYRVVFFLCIFIVRFCSTLHYFVVLLILITALLGKSLQDRHFTVLVHVTITLETWETIESVHRNEWCHVIDGFVHSYIHSLL